MSGLPVAACVFGFRFCFCGHLLCGYQPQSGSSTCLGCARLQISAVWHRRQCWQAVLVFLSGSLFCRRIFNGQQAGEHPISHLCGRLSKQLVGDDGMLCRQQHLSNRKDVQDASCSRHLRADRWHCRQLDFQGYHGLLLRAPLLLRDGDAAGPILGIGGLHRRELPVPGHRICHDRRTLCQADHLDRTLCNWTSALGYQYPHILQPPYWWWAGGFRRCPSYGLVIVSCVTASVLLHLQRFVRN
mmetsp:Transcript_98863/g.235738  ORF Transcript_98863/g.235738 Transcript_98863/m.235738 type:complete len:243 (+) Transcript_98863:218-946(+)